MVSSKLVRRGLTHVAPDSVALGTLCSFVKGLSYKGEYLDLEGPPLLGIGSVLEGGGFRRTLSRSYAGPHQRRHVASAGDVFVAMTNMAEETRKFLGSTAKLPPDFVGGGVLTHHVCGIRWKTTNPVQQDFLYWVMRSDPFMQHCRNFATGTTVYSVRGDDAERFHVPRNMGAEQTELTRLLNAIEAMETSTAQIRQNIRNLVGYLFEALFVRFQPFPSSGGMTCEKEVPRPGQTEPNPRIPTEEFRLPNGWSVVTLGDLASLKMDTISPQRFPDAAFLLHSIPAFDQGQGPSLVLGSQIKSNKLLVPDDAVLLSKLNPRWNRVWLPSTGKSVASITSTEFLPWVPKGYMTRNFLYWMMQSRPFRWSMTSRLTGTTNSHQRVQPTDCESIPVILPSKDAVDSFEQLLSPLMGQLRHASIMAENLRQLRKDALFRFAKTLE